MNKTKEVMSMYQMKSFNVVVRKPRISKSNMDRRERHNTKEQQKIILTILKLLSKSLNKKFSKNTEPNTAKAMW